MMPAKRTNEILKMLAARGVQMQEDGWSILRSLMSAAIHAAEAEAAERMRERCAVVALDMMNYPAVDDDGKPNAYNTAPKIAAAIRKLELEDSECIAS